MTDIIWIVALWFVLSFLISVAATSAIIGVLEGEGRIVIPPVFCKESVYNLAAVGAVTYLAIIINPTDIAVGMTGFLALFAIAFMVRVLKTWKKTGQYFYTRAVALGISVELSGVLALAGVTGFLFLLA